MATLKHINSKNADYGAAEQYLLFEHDEFTMKPVLDETGRLIPREDYRLSTLNCGGEDFAVACMRANLRYEKNQRREDVKSHHYTAGVLPPSATFLKSVNIWDTPSISRPESTSRTRKAIMSRRTNGRFLRIPMSLSLTSRPLTLCRKSVGMSDATRTAGAKQLPSQACFIVPIAAARCMSTAPTTASVFLNIPVPNTAKSQLESSARHSTVSMKMWYCPLSLKC